MLDNSWKKDFAKLEEEINKLAAQVNAQSSIQRLDSAAELRKRLEREGVELNGDDEIVLKQFADSQCSFEDLVTHFHGRLPTQE